MRPGTPRLCPWTRNCELSRRGRRPRVSGRRRGRLGPCFVLQNRRFWSRGRRPVEHVLGPVESGRSSWEPGRRSGRDDLRFGSQDCECRKPGRNSWVLNRLPWTSGRHLPSPVRRFSLQVLDSARPNRRPGSSGYHPGSQGLHRGRKGGRPGQLERPPWSRAPRFSLLHQKRSRQAPIPHALGRRHSVPELDDRGRR